MTIHWKSLTAGVVGAIGGLGAMSLAAQDNTGTGGSDALMSSGDGAVWHASSGSLRYCSYNTTYDRIDCTSWQ